MGRRYMASAINLAVTGTGDFLQLRNGASTVVEIHEIRVCQDSDTAIAPNVIDIRRGTGGAGGATHTEWKYDVSDPDAGVESFDQATTPVGSVDLQMFYGWNLLKEFSWLATPQQRIYLGTSDHLGVALRVSDIITVGWFIHWEEWGV